MALPQIFSSFKYSDSLTVVAISFYTAIVCEAISWLIIYCINSYKSRSLIDKATKKLETMKTESLKESSRNLSLFKFKSGAVVALVLLRLLRS
ncbi:calcium load-activated calcium channel homolog [Juglans microcarpa x Juglans regia]|uniref:calcium load-activated calcium channel homolog n=1 Tax=Juglans microcarpa x Juglans regia TaxID=2249226 RepID=UPI001B7E83E0|nr:calcium load-activated calcium channel homolog [Juglans microcarpa x Juglans regia]